MSEFTARKLVGSPGRQFFAHWVRGQPTSAIIRRCLQALYLSEALAVVLSAVVAKLLYIDYWLGEPQDTLWYLGPAFALAFVLHYFLKQYRLHDIDTLLARRIGFGSIWGCLVLAFMVVLGGMFLLKTAEAYSRGWFIIWLVLGALSLVGVRGLFMRHLREMFEDGFLSRYIALYGSREYVARVKSHIETDMPYAVVSGVYLSDGGTDAAGRQEPGLGDLRKALDTGAYEKVVICAAPDDTAQIREAVRGLAPYAPETLLCTQLRALPVPLHGSCNVGKLRAGIVSPVSEAEHCHLQKRVLDYAVALPALIVLAPVFGLVALAIKLDSKGPVFFRQRRYGRNNKMFRIFKFRSMLVEEDGAVVTQAVRDDKRVTRVGRFLRKTSLDELPQLINVLLGHMSIVGPRPHALAHEEAFEQSFDLFSRRRRVLPGITGWAQVNGCRGETRTNEAVRQRMDYDLDYVDKWSIWLDVEIIVRTFVAVLRGNNAY